jgi:hypothetical protein
LKQTGSSLKSDTYKQIYDLALQFPGIFKKKEYKYPDTDFYTNSYSRIIHNIEELKMNQMSIN